MSGDGLTVTGGAGGTAARLEDLAQAASVLEGAADGLLGVAGGLARVAAAPHLLATALVAPGTLAAAEAALVGTLAGPSGAVAEGARLDLLAVRLRTAGAAYAAAELAARGAAARLASVTGGLGDAAHPVLAVGAGFVLAGPPWSPWSLPAPVALLEQGGQVARVLPGALLPAGPLLAPLADVPAAARAFGALPRLGPVLAESAHVAVTARTEPATPPTGLADVVGRIDRCHPDGAGPVAVRVEGVHGPDGRRAWVVEIPGTQTWSPLPGADPFDLTGDVAAMGGTATAAGATVTRGLELAGAAPDEPVLLAGHSLGGLVAAGLAADPAFRRRFRVTHVVTAGSPVRGAHLPDGIAVLSLEHDDDLVPAIDGAANPDRPDWVTVRRRGGPAWRSPGAAHAVSAYAATAALAERSPAVSLRAWRAGLRPFLARPGATASTLVVVGRRRP